MKSSNETRQELIDVTYEEVYERGYQGASLSRFYQSTSSQRLYVLFFCK